jgi:hypothetical protein
MIKFFRKIRQKLLSENKFSKYLIYAIGEIFLVVIGILIALYINNKNQISLNEESTDILMNEVLLDLENIITASNDLMDFYHEKEILFDLILNNKLTYEDYSNNRYPNLWEATTWYRWRDKKRTAYDNLTTTITSIPNKYKSIFKDLGLFYSNVYSEKYRDLIENMSIENIKKKADNYEWYSFPGPHSQNKEMIKFMLNDYLYRNEVLHYQRNVTIHTRYVFNDKQRAQKIYKEIAMHLHKPIINDIIGYNLELFENIIGDWESDQAPGVSVTVYEDEKQLFRKTSIDSVVVQFHPISNTKLIDDYLNFISIEKKGDRIIAKQTDGTNWIKVN